MDHAPAGTPTAAPPRKSDSGAGNIAADTNGDVTCRRAPRRHGESLVQNQDLVQVGDVSLFRDRLMAGRGILGAAIGVRVSVPERDNEKGILMVSNGNSFGLNGSSAGGNCSIQDPESTVRLGDKFMWGWSPIQSFGNVL